MAGRWPRTLINEMFTGVPDTFHGASRSVMVSDSGQQARGTGADACPQLAYTQRAIRGR